MSTAAIWVFVAVGVLFVLALIFVVLAARSTYGRSRTLAAELQGLTRDAETVLQPGKPGRHAGKPE